MKNKAAKRARIKERLGDQYKEYCRLKLLIKKKKLPRTMFAKDEKGNTIHPLRIVSTLSVLLGK